MALFISERNVSAAWVKALDLLLSGDGEAVNMTVVIADATDEDEPVRSVIDAFVEERRERNRSVKRVSTVANTIFPETWYIEKLGIDAEEHLYELERATRGVKRRHSNNHRGTYFERFVAWPGPDHTSFNQLDQVVRRLRDEHDRGHRRGNKYEIGVTTPGDETVAIAVPVYVGGRDNQIMSFPCLSHISFSLQKGVVHMAAMYRNHDLTQRAYGNYIGLGRLLRFVAQQSNWPAGELSCASTSVSVGSGSGFGRAALTELLAECRKAEEGSVG